MRSSRGERAEDLLAHLLADPLARSAASSPSSVRNTARLRRSLACGRRSARPRSSSESSVATIVLGSTPAASPMACCVIPGSRCTTASTPNSRGWRPSSASSALAKRSRDCRATQFMRKPVYWASASGGRSDPIIGRTLTRTNNLRVKSFGPRLARLHRIRARKLVQCGTAPTKATFQWEKADRCGLSGRGRRSFPYFWLQTCWSGSGAPWCSPALSPDHNARAPVFRKDARMSASAPDTIVLIHGFWVTPRSWEHWAAHYEGRGFRVIAPAYPGFEVEVEALNADPTPIETAHGAGDHRAPRGRHRASSTRRRSSWATRRAARSCRSCSTTATARPASRSTRRRPRACRSCRSSQLKVDVPGAQEPGQPAQGGRLHARAVALRVHEHVQRGGVARALRALPRPAPRGDPLGQRAGEPPARPPGRPGSTTRTTTARRCCSSPAARTT